MCVAPRAHDELLVLVQRRLCIMCRALLVNTNFYSLLSASLRLATKKNSDEADSRVVECNILFAPD